MFLAHYQTKLSWINHYNTVTFLIWIQVLLKVKIQILYLGHTLWYNAIFLKKILFLCHSSSIHIYGGRWKSFKAHRRGVRSVLEMSTLFSSGILQTVCSYPRSQLKMFISGSSCCARIKIFERVYKYIYTHTQSHTHTHTHTYIYIYIYIYQHLPDSCTTSRM